MAAPKRSATQTQSFVRQSDVNKAQAAVFDLTATLSDFEAGIQKIATDYANERKSREKQLADEQGKRLKELAIEASILKNKKEEELQADLAEKHLQLRIQEYRQIQDLELKGVKLSEEQRQKLREANERKQNLENKKAILKQFQEMSAQQQAKENAELAEVEAQIALLDPESTLRDKLGALGTGIKAGIMEGLGGSGNNLYDGLKQMTSKIVGALSEETDRVIEKYKDFTEDINVRLQGSNKTFAKLENTLTNAIGVNPLFKMEDALDNLNELVGQGINYNVEQRAFLNTVSEKVADTFDAADAALLQIVKLQQSDSSAARLGMEAHLTKYLNSMFEDSQYLSEAYDQVSEALLAASATMSTAESVSFEYQVQKWLGSLSSVGMSAGTVTGLAEALGYLGSGNISALNNSQMQNLLVMAASRAGLSYADLLVNGLTERTTNILLGSVTSYLQEIATSASNVVKSQFAEVFGVNITDLTAALNLNTATLNTISKDTMSYGQDIAELRNSLNTAYSKTSSAEIIDNIFDNLQFGLATSIGSSPALSALWRVTSMIESATGGINIPAITASVLGTGGGIDLNATVEQLMKLGIMGIGSLGMIGQVVSGVGSTINPASMLKKMGISSEVTYTSRGSGLAAVASGLTQSQSTVVGNVSGDTYSAQALNVAEAEADTKVKAKQDKEKEKQEKSFEDIYNILIGQETSLLQKLANTNERIYSLLYTRGESYKPAYINDIISNTSNVVSNTSSIMTSGLASVTSLSAISSAVIAVPKDEADHYNTVEAQIASIDDNVKNIADTLSDIKEMVSSIEDRMRGSGTAYGGTTSYFG